MLKRVYAYILYGERKMTKIYPIPDEILNDPNHGLVSPQYGGFAWFDSDYKIWFWNTETGEKYQVKIEEEEVD